MVRLLIILLYGSFGHEWQDYAFSLEDYIKFIRSFCSKIEIS